MIGGLILTKKQRLLKHKKDERIKFLDSKLKTRYEEGGYGLFPPPVSNDEFVAFLVEMYGSELASTMPLHPTQFNTNLLYTIVKHLDI